jgi:hypothetical protein
MDYGVGSTKIFDLSRLGKWGVIIVSNVIKT